MGYCASFHRVDNEEVVNCGNSNAVEFLIKLKNDFYKGVKKEHSDREIEYDYDVENRNHPIVNLSILRDCLNQEFIWLGQNLINSENSDRIDIFDDSCDIIRDLRSIIYYLSENNIQEDLIVSA